MFNILFYVIIQIISHKRVTPRNFIRPSSDQKIRERHTIWDSTYIHIINVMAYPPTWATHFKSLCNVRTTNMNAFCVCYDDFMQRAMIQDINIVAIVLGFL